VLYERDQAFGGAQLTQLIVRQYGFSPEEPKPSAPANCPTTTRLGAASLRRAWRRNRPRPAVLLHQHPFNRVDHIMLAGGSAALPGWPRP
jgi:type IV pilus assembly protein PilM